MGFLEMKCGVVFGLSSEKVEEEVWKKFRDRKEFF